MSEQEYAKVISKNLKRIMYQKGKSQAEVAKDLGIHKGTLSTWMNGTRIPRMPKVDMLCKYFGVTRSEILEDKKPAKAYTTRIPVLGRVAAGVPIEAIEDILDWEEISPEMALDGEYFALQIKGDSMSPRMLIGDVVIVRQQPDAESGDVVIVQVDGERATCKKLMKHAGGISLLSFNPAYDPITFSNKDIETLPVTILGKVVENRQKY